MIMINSVQFSNVHSKANLCLQVMAVSWYFSINHQSTFFKAKHNLAAAEKTDAKHKIMIT